MLMAGRYIRRFKENQKMKTPLSLALLLMMALPGCASQGLPDVIYLARHGQTEWNRLSRWQGNPDLDQVGYINRVSLWHLLKDEPLRDIYTSSRKRTQRTAELLAEQHDLKVKVRPGLDEISPGIAKGICFSQFAPHKARPSMRKCEVSARGSHPEVALKVLQEAYRAQEKLGIKGKMPLGESLLDINDRSKPVVDELRLGLSKRKILVIAHGVMNRALLHQFMGWPLKNLSHLRQENDQVYRIEGAKRGKPKLFLYTPGSGWKRCKKAPKPGARHLDCSPKPAPPAVAPAPAPEPEPAPAPAAAPEPEPASAPDAPAPAPAPEKK
jgi:broad specificity phosphatase PhoE